jgi:hypothetical protein
VSQGIEAFKGEDAAMTHLGGKPHTNVGDKGQRFEIHGIMYDGTDEVFGWTNDADANAVVKKVKQWPKYKDAYVMDRGVRATPLYSED